jgi:triosephosphate isomerase
MKKLIVANWKMNPLSLRAALYLAKVSDKSGVVICPPYPFLVPIVKTLKRAVLGAQDAFWENEGAYTGEVSPEMLRSIGCDYAIIGHSERRRYFGETDEMINKKVLAGLEAGLKVILCVGEDLSIRHKGLQAVKKFVRQQLQKDLQKLTSNSKLPTPNLLVAYEPVWAIGTGKADSPKDSLEVITFIRDFLRHKLKAISYKLLYGGSVNAKNAAGFLAVSDGLLVGGASLKPKEFLKIISQMPNGRR